MNRSVFRVYIKPFDTLGEYEDDWTEVTDDVVLSSLGSIKQELDNTEYDVGVFRSSSFSLTLRNNHGKYSDADVLQSIFRYKRSDSQVRVTWELDNEGAYTGWTELSEAYLSNQVDVFQGLLSDEASSFSVDSLNVSFKVLGMDALFSRVAVPFADISNGDTFEEILLACLDQSTITNLLVVSSGNIECEVNSVTDDVSSLEGKTVLEALKEILQLSNSVLYIENQTVYVAPREETSTTEFEFYGQASQNGVENIQAIDNVRTGSQRIINYLTWRDTGIIETDATSTAFWGIRKKELDSEIITNTTKRRTILQSIRDEFKDRKKEFKLKTPLNYDTLDLFLLDKVGVDYPIQYVEGDFPLPICGIAVCGEAVTPLGVWSFEIPATDRFKIMSKEISLKDGFVNFGVREV